jgi:hypothetical protein
MIGHDHGRNLGKRDELERLLGAGQVVCVGRWTVAPLRLGSMYAKQTL